MLIMKYVSIFLNKFKCSNYLANILLLLLMVNSLLLILIFRLIFMIFIGYCFVIVIVDVIDCLFWSYFYGANVGVFLLAFLFKLTLFFIIFILILFIFIINI